MKAGVAHDAARARLTDRGSVRVRRAGRARRPATGRVVVGGASRAAAVKPRTTRECTGRSIASSGAGARRDRAGGTSGGSARVGAVVVRADAIAVVHPRRAHVRTGVGAGNAGALTQLLIRGAGSAARALHAGGGPVRRCGARRTRRSAAGEGGVADARAVAQVKSCLALQGTRARVARRRAVRIGGANLTTVAARRRIVVTCALGSTNVVAGQAREAALGSITGRL